MHVPKPMLYEVTLGNYSTNPLLLHNLYLPINTFSAGGDWPLVMCYMTAALDLNFPLVGVFQQHSTVYTFIYLCHSKGDTLHHTTYPDWVTPTLPFSTHTYYCHCIYLVMFT